MGVQATLSTPAYAQTKADDAKSHYEQGVAFYDEADYQAALIEFKRSYEMSPNFNVLFNIGQTYYQLADYANALKTFQQYLDDGGKRVPAARRTDVEKDVDKLKGRVATLKIKINVEGADLKVDDVLVAQPISGPVLVSAGKRRIEVSKQGYKTVTKTEEFAGQENREVVIELQPEVTIINDKTNEQKVVIIGGDTIREPGPPVGPIVLWTLTGVFAITTGVMGGLALGADSDLQDLKKQPGTSEGDIQDQADTASTFAIVSDVFLGATIVSAAAAVIFTAVEISSGDDSKKKDEKAPPKPNARLLVGPTFMGLDARF
ncbi:MAG: hypothetical protein U0271_00485 [Polyangiaceae bacterium]